MTKPTLATLLCMAQLCFGQHAAAPRQQSSPGSRPAVNPSSPPTLTYGQLISSGYNLLKQARTGEAYLAATRAAEKDPQRFEAYALAALVLHIRGADAEAKNFIDKALPLAPPEKKRLLGEMAAQITKGLLAASNPAPKADPTRTNKDNEPTLQVTMKYISDRLNEVRVGYYYKVDGEDVYYEDSISAAQGNPVDCSLSWHLETHALSRSLTSSGLRPIYYEKWRLSLRDVSVVTVGAGYASDRRLGIEMQAGKKANVTRSDNYHQAAAADENVSKTDLHLPDEDLAYRLAKAVVHAVELCGGGENDPFK